MKSRDCHLWQSSTWLPRRESTFYPVISQVKLGWNVLAVRFGIKLSRTSVRAVSIENLSCPSSPCMHFWKWLLQSSDLITFRCQACLRAPVITFSITFHSKISKHWKSFLMPILQVGIVGQVMNLWPIVTRWVSDTAWNRSQVFWFPVVI